MTEMHTAGIWDPILYFLHRDYPPIINFVFLATEGNVHDLSFLNMSFIYHRGRNTVKIDRDRTDRL